MIDITDRKNSFYWQTDRKLTAEEYNQYFLKRHDIPVAEIETVLRNGIKSVGEIKSISIVEPDTEVLRGNVNIVRKVRVNEEVYIVRIHPRGIKNGYFYAEREALRAVANYGGIPVPRVIEIHEATNEADMDFALMTLCPGITMQSTILANPAIEPTLVYEAGRMLAQIHQVKVAGYGSFNNQIAKKEKKLVGLHSSYRDFIHTGLAENLQRLVAFSVITADEVKNFEHIFETYNFEPKGEPTLVHNDYADWNMLVDSGSISAILDWDECHAGDPIADLACWSTFFDMDRFVGFIEGYRSVTGLPEDFDTRFHFFRLRYTISKMALRVKRATVDNSQFVKDKIQVGTKALAEEVIYFANHS